MKKAIRCFSVLVLILVQKLYYTHAQTPITDSLKQKIHSSTQLNEQLDNVIKLCARGHSLSADTFYYFIRLGQQIALPGSPEYFLVENAYVRYLAKVGKTKEADFLVDSLLKVIPQNEKYYDASQWLRSNRSNIYIHTSRQKEAINEGFIILKNAEKANDAYWIARSYIGIGWANMELGKYDDAIKWLSTGINSTNDEKILVRCNYLFSNIASCYNNIGMQDSAFHFIELGLKYARLAQNLSQVANSLNIRADIYIKQKSFLKAATDLEEALKIRQQIGDKIYIVADMAQLSSFYASINETKKGIEVAKEAIAIATKLKSLSRLIFIYNSLAENYKAAGMNNEYAQVLEKIIKLKDSLSEKNSAEAIANFETKYELQKKENIIVQQEMRISRNRYVTIGSLLLLALISLILGLVYRNRQLIKNRKMEMDLVEQRVQAKVAVKQAQENERKRIAADLHDNIGVYAAAITHNVRSLKSDDNSMQTITENLEENVQSMVAQLNNTIWVLKNEQLSLISLSDRFKLWMQRLMKSYTGVTYQFSENIVNDRVYTPSVMLNLFYSLIECVNNSLKHSGCTAIKIEFNNNGSSSIIVEDNGKGMSENIVYGNGIMQVKQRMKESGWTVQWIPVEPHGTRIIFTNT